MSFITHFIITIICASLAAPHNLTEKEILEFDIPNEIQEAAPYDLAGYDEDGSPIWSIELGKWDMRKYAEKGGEMYDALEIHADKMLLNIKESGLNSSTKQLYTIVDVDGFNIRQAGDPKTVQFVLRLILKVEEFGRQMLLKQAWIVNANTLFEGIWRLSGPLLGQKAEAFELYTNNKESWLPKLLKVLPRDQLPEKYGGSPSYKPVKQFG
ncbi:unnamed protein product [Allacma fusca]|uniref:CRAL-TRIO domain-containing protein n=1 Tax=Allacma fusca TaxID=39272 RepID=A0A8J2P6R4_9HEXA|nr:unnamed protein product [Allacma fusca]